MTTNEKLERLRGLMRERKMAAYIIPSGDAHQSEYAADYWNTRAWVSGFTGSSGLLVVTEKDAGLWTDGRYFIQAAQQLADTGITLFRMNEAGVPTYTEWLAQLLPENAVVGFDGRTVSVTAYERLQKEIKKAVFAYDQDLVDRFWSDRPRLPMAAAFEHSLRFAGRSRVEKINRVREAMKNADMHLIASLDDIAWLLNLRGGDILNTPVVYSYCLVTQSETHLFIDAQKLDETIVQSLTDDGVTLHPYDEVFAFLAGMTTGGRLLYNPQRVSVKLADAIPKNMETVKDADVTTALKAVKDEHELRNIRNAYIKDGVAMVRFLIWLEKAVAQGTLDEADIDGAITGFRMAQPDCLGASFETIAAYMENAALMHYSPKKGACKTIKPEGFLLVDSGGQYLDGTTDVTRTIVMGPVTDAMKHDFTLVLKGHIGLASAWFLSGVTGTNLDAFARAPLWAEGIDYKSGTGHGIGYCLGVHEGPHGIGMRRNDTKLVPGMLVTNEPGVYKENRYGIRTENVLLIKEMASNEDGVFLGFETISYCPIDWRAIDFDLLTPDERTFLNTYHQTVREVLNPYLNQSEQAWLAEATAAR